jgi:energy-coupling factor transporter transmembrane protein EcfT
MKSQLIIKVLFIFPVVVLIDYVFMILLGCTSCLLGLGNDFYCGPYCLIGKIIAGLTALLFFFLIFPNLKAIFKTHGHAASTEK